MSRTLYIAYSGTYERGMKIGDGLVAAYMVRLWCENEPHDRILLSLNPKYELNFVFDKVIRDHHIQIVRDDWGSPHAFECHKRFDERRAVHEVEGVKFDTYKEIYLRIYSGDRQKAFRGSEIGMGRGNIFHYMFFGQESSPEYCQRAADFRPSAFGFEWNPLAPLRSVFVVPHAVCQSNDVFTLDFWKQVVTKLLEFGISVTINTPQNGWFGYHPLLSYCYFPNDFRALFKKVSEQRLVLSMNTGPGWIAAAHGVPLMAMENEFFWFLEFKYRPCGVPAVEIFPLPDVERVTRSVNAFLS